MTPVTVGIIALICLVCFFVGMGLGLAYGARILRQKLDTNGLTLDEAGNIVSVH